MWENDHRSCETSLKLKASGASALLLSLNVTLCDLTLLRQDAYVLYKNSVRTAQ